jgi:hypothetical protein
LAANPVALETVIVLVADALLPVTALLTASVNVVPVTVIEPSAPVPRLLLRSRALSVTGLPGQTFATDWVTLIVRSIRVPDADKVLLIAPVEVIEIFPLFVPALALL